MKKTWIFWISLVLLLSVPATLLAWGFGLPAQFGDTFLGELKEKTKLLSQTEGKRVVLVGGSSLAFGVDSALLERALPEYRVVNFGMYAALGTTVMLDLSEPLIRAGDIVILLPEQQRQTLSGFFDPAIAWQGLDGAYDLLRSLPGEKLARLAGAFPEFAGEKWAYFLTGTRPEPQGVYRKSVFNEYGDVVSPLCGANRMPGGFDSDTPIEFDPAMLTEDFIRQVEDYRRALEARGAQVWYGFCSMNALAAQTQGIEDFCQAVTEKLGLPILGDPRDSILPAGWFFDTNFHLNSSGKTVYTRLLARNIKAMLGDSSPTQIALPAMPAWEQTVAEGDNTDAGCFTYTEDAAGLTVTGLTPEGLTRQTLTLPASWEGKPVISIASGAFSQAAGLERVTVQGNIRSIGDGAFSGCGALGEIRLTAQDPGACRVGQNLLEGTSARILVPEEALPDYKTNYFWSIYADRVDSYS